MHVAVQHSPRFTDEFASDLASSLFGLHSSARQLPSERDQNFHLMADSGDQYVLKIANSLEDRAALDLQNAAMTHVARHQDLFSDGQTSRNAICPDILRTVDGREIATIMDTNGNLHFVRVLTYLPGKPLAEVRPHSPGLLSSLGSFVAHLGRALQDFDHPAAHRDFHWDLKHAGCIIRAHSSDIGDAQNRDLVRSFLGWFEEGVSPNLNHLPLSIVHNDGNDHNVLVLPSGNWDNRVSSIIDFGDMVHTYRVADLAIATAYVLFDKPDPLDAAACVVAGYHAVSPLSDLELRILFPLICMRLCTSVTLAAHQQQMEPGNKYLRISERPAWETLGRLAHIEPELAHYVLRHACDLEPCPKTSRIKSWLRSQQAEFHTIMDVNFAGQEQQVLDLSVQSPLLIGPEPPGEGEGINSTLSQRGQAKVAIGRYDEVRLVYTGDRFQVPYNELPESRTVHLGVDLFSESGTPIFAPLQGTVRSLQDNGEFGDYGPTVILEHVTDDGDAFFTLYGHLSRHSLKALKLGMPLHVGAKIGEIGNQRENGNWPPHVHFQIIVDLLGWQGDFPGVSASVSARCMALHLS